MAPIWRDPEVKISKDAGIQLFQVTICQEENHLKANNILVHSSLCCYRPQ